MPRFFLPKAEMCRGEILSLPAELRHHLKTVLRVPVGAEIELFNGAGLIAGAVVLSDGVAEVQSVKRVAVAACAISLIQGLPKGNKLELVLQKGTELGVNRFLPTRMARSVGQLKAERQQKRLERWGKIIQSAACQCGQPHLPELLLSSSLEDSLAMVAADLKLMLWEESARPLEQLLPKNQPREVAVLVGPEGGITEEEAQKAQQAGYQPVSLGPRILRTETAGLAIVTILQYLYGDLAKGRCGSDAVPQERMSHEMP
ncbi:MAG: 16S rRNA (uracil(1498)-N(3))-methyltransferase [Desulfuromonadales bacterium]|nr:16S rRNA (uracil(1498)-N(3))-methyltransferase [Desulfuromonadales bacterium]